MGDVATASLQKLNDGQNDDIAMLRRRRAEEAEEAASVTGRPVWDTSTWMYVPSSLKGLKPSTSEPWARDGDVYSGGMSKYGAARPNYDPPQYVDVDSRTQDAMPRHVTLIENAMRQLRKEINVGGGGAEGGATVQVAAVAGDSGAAGCDGSPGSVYHSGSPAVTPRLKLTYAESLKPPEGWRPGDSPTLSPTRKGKRSKVGGGKVGGGGGDEKKNDDDDVGGDGVGAGGGGAGRAGLARCSGRTGGASGRATGASARLAAATDGNGRKTSTAAPMRTTTRTATEQSEAGPTSSASASSAILATSAATSPPSAAHSMSKSPSSKGGRGGTKGSPSSLPSASSPSTPGSPESIIPSAKTAKIERVLLGGGSKSQDEDGVMQGAVPEAAKGAGMGGGGAAAVPSSTRPRHEVALLASPGGDEEASSELAGGVLPKPEAAAAHVPPVGTTLSTAPPGPFRLMLCLANLPCFTPAIPTIAQAKKSVRMIA